MKRTALILLALGLIVVAVVFLAGRNAPAPVERTAAIMPAASPAATPSLPQPLPPQTVAFADPAGCVPAPSLIALLDQMTPTDQAGRPAQPFAPQLAPVPDLVLGIPRLVSDGTTHRVKVPAQGGWHGLTLVGLSRWWAEESDYAGFALHFANPPQQVIAALNGQGFDLPPSGAREVGIELATFLAVTPQGAGARFSCST